ncbi:hypothetical protein CDIK_2705 [Cucumispora dikerogammari]|nr:hypothetical protein CDIK_2705 [Cucumispora dikerogammari]
MYNSLSNKTVITHNDVKTKNIETKNANIYLKNDDSIGFLIENICLLKQQKFTNKELIINKIHTNLIDFICKYEFDRFLLEYFKNNRFYVKKIEETEIDEGEMSIISIMSSILFFLLKEPHNDISLHHYIKILSLFENVWKLEFNGMKIKEIVIKRFGYSKIYQHFMNGDSKSKTNNEYNENLFLCNLIASEKIICSRFTEDFNRLISFANDKVFDKTIIQCTRTLNIMMSTTNMMKNYVEVLLTFYAEYSIKPENFICMELSDFNLLLEVINNIINSITSIDKDIFLYNIYKSLLKNITKVTEYKGYPLLSTREETYCYCSNIFTISALYENISKMGMRELSINKNIFGFDREVLDVIEINVKEPTFNDKDIVSEGSIFLDNLGRQEQIRLSNVYFNCKYKYICNFLNNERLIEDNNVKSCVSRTLKNDLLKNGTFVNDLSFLKTMSQFFSIYKDYIMNFDTQTIYLMNPTLMLNTISTAHENRNYIKYLYERNNISELYFLTTEFLKSIRKKIKVKENNFILFKAEQVSLKTKTLTIKRHNFLHEIILLRKFTAKDIQEIQEIVNDELKSGVIKKLTLAHLITIVYNNETARFFKQIFESLNEKIFTFVTENPLVKICELNIDYDKNVRDNYESIDTKYRYYIFILSLILRKCVLFDFEIKYYHHTYIAILLSEIYNKAFFKPEKPFFETLFHHSIMCNEIQKAELKCVSNSKCGGCNNLYMRLCEIMNIVKNN